jgi:hypothetical protein
MKRRKAHKAGDQENDRSEKITPSNAKRAVAVGKVLAPVLLPIAMRAAATARGAWDVRRARKLGVSPAELGEYSGRGGALLARIAGIAGSLRELRTGGQGDRAAADAFVADTEPRLTDLAAAVRAAEQMPTERRRAAHRAVATELNRIEPELLRLLGVDSSGSAGSPVGA